MDEVTIYVLKLEGAKFYIGRTNNISQRIDNHFNGEGCNYTKKYKPICVEETYEDMSPFDEDRMVKEYMNIYGIQNVRGGSYSYETLSPSEIKFLQREIWGATSKCFNCGGDHFSNQCTIKRNDEDNSPKMSCTRCFRNSHTIEACYAKTDLSGRSLSPEVVEQPKIILSIEPSPKIILPIEPSSTPSSSLFDYIPFLEILFQKIPFSSKE